MAKGLFAGTAFIFLLLTSMSLSCSNNSGNDSKQNDSPSPYDLQLYNAVTSPSLPGTFKTNDNTSVSFTAFISNQGVFVTNSLYIYATVYVTNLSGLGYADIRNKCYPLLANGGQYNMPAGESISISIPSFNISAFTLPGSNYYYILISIDDNNNYEYPDKTPGDNVFQLNYTPVIVTE